MVLSLFYILHLCYFSLRYNATDVFVRGPYPIFYTVTYENNKSSCTHSKRVIFGSSNRHTACVIIHQKIKILYEID